ncbi:unnamed protein product [Musa acuminata subsp. burmannicoides]
MEWQSYALSNDILDFDILHCRQSLDLQCLFWLLSSYGRNQIQWSQVLLALHSPCEDLIATSQTQMGSTMWIHMKLPFHRITSFVIHVYLHADGEEDDADVDGEGRHRLIAQLHVLPTEAVDRVRHGLPVAQVLLVRILQLHPHLSQAAALRLLRQRPIVEAPAVLVAHHVVGLPQLNELLRGSLERERRRVGMVLLRQPSKGSERERGRGRWNGEQDLLVVGSSRFDEIRESFSQILFLLASAGVRLGLSPDPTFVRAGPVNPGVDAALSSWFAGGIRCCCDDVHLPQCGCCLLPPTEKRREGRRGRGGHCKSDGKAEKRTTQNQEI